MRQKSGIRIANKAKATSAEGDHVGFDGIRSSETTDLESRKNGKIIFLTPTPILSPDIVAQMRPRRIDAQ